MDITTKIFITNHKALAGAALVEHLKNQGFPNVLTSNLDLLNQDAVNIFFAKEKPEYVIITSQKSGSIKANLDYPAEFLYDNLQSQTNVIEAAYKSGVKKLLYLAASCIYPIDARQLIKEEAFLIGPLEQTSLPYATAKIAGIIMCQSYNQQYKTNFISAVPATLYGPGDEFHPEKSHVLTALVKKFHEAKEARQKEITLWGTGSPIREFLYTEDLASACLFLLDNYDDSSLINIGSSEEISIKKLAKIIAKTVGFQGEIKWDLAKPDGAARKVLDSSKLRTLGWRHKVILEEGIKKTYEWYLSNALPTSPLSELGEGER